MNDTQHQIVSSSQHLLPTYIAFAIVILSGFVFFAYQKYVTPVDPQAISQPTQSLQTQTNEGILSWKTYNNDQYDFVFRYPNNYIIDTSSSNNNCDYVTTTQSSCLAMSRFKISDSEYAPEISFYLLKGMGSANISGQIESIEFSQQKNAWIYSYCDGRSCPEQILTPWDHTNSGKEIIKSLIGGSHGSASYYLIPDYKKDIIAIFAIPQSFRLRCDAVIDRSKQAQCNSFYHSVIKEYNEGKVTDETWLPVEYLADIYKDSELVVRGSDFITIANATPSSDRMVGWKTYVNEKYGYELKYPSGIYNGRYFGDIQDPDPRTRGDKPISQLASVQIVTEGPGGTIFNVDSSRSLVEVLQDLKRTLLKNQNETSLIISGISWIRFYGEPQDQPEGSLYYLTSHNGNVYFVQVNIEKDIMELILSTFSFTIGVK